MNFDDAWYPDSQIVYLKQAATDVLSLKGHILEIGSWKGKSTIAIAEVVRPLMVHAIDTWKGSIDESPNHATIKMAEQEDIRSIFFSNVRESGLNNIKMHQMDWRLFFATEVDVLHYGVKFIHIDASHDYISVYDNIYAVLPYMVVGGIICGDDILSANITRGDLQGGVERAVRELCPGFIAIENFWRWTKS